MHPTAAPPRPPFACTLTAPIGWQVLRGDAPSLRDDLVALVARSATWSRLTQRQRRGTATLLGAVASAAATSGALLTLLRVGEEAAGDHQAADPDVATITLTWVRTAPVLADLDLAAAVLGEVGLDGHDRQEVETGLGAGLLDDRVETSPTGTTMVSSQLVVPLRESTWLASLTGTTASPTRAPALRQALLAVAAGLDLRRPTTAR